MDTRLPALTGAALPIVQAPMAGAAGVELAAAAIGAGALGSLPGALLSPEQLRAQVSEVRSRVAGPLNLNFFCHALPEPPDETQWRALLAPYYAEEKVEPGPPAPLRRPFDEAMCALVEHLRPQVVSFHFGLPDPALLARVKRAGCRVFGNATTVEEARWLAARGCDAVIAQGAEAGGHAGWFLDGHRPVALAALLQQVTAAVALPVIAAGGIVDAAGVAAAIAAGAAGVQVGTAYLATPESRIAEIHRALLGTPASADTAFTNLLSGRAARGIRNRLMRELGPIRDEAPAFPYASNALAPLRTRAEADGRGDYSPLWAGAGAPLVQAMDAAALTARLAQGVPPMLGKARGEG